MRVAPPFGYSLLLIAALSPAIAAQEKPKDGSPAGVLPKGVDGKPLNLDFETGDLRDWVAAGDAFGAQPIKGDSVYARRQDMKSEHTGDFWVGTFERQGDAPQGT